jgi:hypothetical protein
MHNAILASFMPSLTRIKLARRLGSSLRFAIDQLQNADKGANPTFTLEELINTKSAKKAGESCRGYGVLS